MQAFDERYWRLCRRFGSACAYGKSNKSARGNVSVSVEMVKNRS